MENRFSPYFIFLPALRSLERRARYLFYCMFFCSFFLSTISRQPAGGFTPKYACGRTLDPDVSSPFWGLAAPGGRKKEGMKFSLLWESMGNFCILAVFERYLSNAWTDPHKIYLCRDNVCRHALSHVGSIGPWGREERELKTQKIGGGLIRA